MANESEEVNKMLGYAIYYIQQADVKNAEAWLDNVKEFSMQRSLTFSPVIGNVEAELRKIKTQGLQEVRVEIEQETEQLQTETPEEKYRELGLLALGHAHVGSASTAIGLTDLMSVYLHTHKIDEGRLSKEEERISNIQFIAYDIGAEVHLSHTILNAELRGTAKSFFDQAVYCAEKIGKDIKDYKQKSYYRAIDTLLKDAENYTRIGKKPETTKTLTDLRRILSSASLDPKTRLSIESRIIDIESGRTLR